MTGPIYGLPFDEYLQLDGLNGSLMSHGRTSMRHMNHEATKRDQKETPAMRWGKISHAAILEPERFAVESSIWEGAKRSGNAYKEFVMNAPDPELVITEEESDKLSLMQERVCENDMALQLIDETAHEVSFNWNVPNLYGTGKARLDMYRPSEDHTGGVICDYKTTADITPYGFWKTAYGQWYHAKMGWYVHGVEIVTGERLPVWMIVQENKAPFDCWVCQMGPEIVKIGEEEAVAMARQYRASQVCGQFGGVVDGVVEYELPAWAYSDKVNMEGLT